MNKKTILVAIVCFIAVILFYTFRTEIEIEKIESKYELVNESFVSKKDNKIILEGFKEKIVNLEKNGEKIIFISDHKKYGVKRYTYDLKTDDFIYKANDTDLVLNNLFHNENKDIIAEKILKDIKKINSEALYKISNNKEKILYINKDDNLVSYNRLNDNKIIIPYKIDNIKKGDIINNYDFSRKSGYISIYSKENHLSIFGADTGNLYGNKILGINPNWISDNKLIMFYNDTKKNDTKLGIYDVVKKDIDYFYNSKNKIYNKVFYSENIISFFELNQNNKLLLVQYDEKKSVFKKILLDDLNYEDIVDVKIDINKVIIVSKVNENNSLKIINLLTKNTLEYNNVSKIKNSFYKEINNSLIIRVDDRFLKINFKNENFLTENSSELSDIYLDLKDICVLNFKKNNEYFLEIIKYN